MTHAKDRTLLSRLGFEDPDKKNPLHDLACRYVALPELLPAVLNTAVDLARFKPRRGSYPYGDKPDLPGRLDGRVVDLSNTSARPFFEEPVSKGSGQYKVTIGFMDACLSVRANAKVCGTRTINEPIIEQLPPDPLPPAFESLPPDSTLRMLWSKGKQVKHDNLVSYPWVADAGDPDFGRSEFTIAIEVKIGHESAANSLRQLNLYREHVGEKSVFDTPWGYDDGTHWLLVTAYPLSAGDTEMLRSQGVAHLKLGPKFDAWAKAQQDAPPDRNEEI